MRNFSYTRATDIFAAWLRQAPYLPLGIFAITSIVVYFLSGSVYQFAQNIANTKATNSDTQVLLEKKPVSEQEYTAAINFCKQNTPEVKCSASAGKMKVEITDGQHYADWIFALSSLQSHAKDMLWETDSLCVGACSGASASATLIAYNQKIIVK